MSDQASLGDISSSDTTDDPITETDRQLNLGPFTLEIPENWEITEFNQDIDLVNGVNYESKHYCEEGEGRLFLTLNAVKKGGGFKQDGIKHYGGPVDEEKILSPGDLLIANTDLTQEGEVVGYPFQVPEFSGDEREIVPSMDLSIMDLKNKKFNKTFLQYLFRTNYIHSRLRSFSAGSTVLHLNTDLTENMDLPVPPKDEQRRIASVFYNVDQAIQKTEEIIEQTQRVKKGLMQDLLVEGLDREKIEKKDALSPTSIGKLPSNWEKVKLKQVAEERDDSLVDGPFGSNLKSEEYVEDGYSRLVQLQNIREGEFINETKRYINKDKFEELKRHSAEPGDLAIAKMAAPVARACVLPEIEENYTVVADCIMLSVDEEEYETEFVMHCLNSYWIWRQAFARSRGSTRKRINLTQLKELEIPKPPKEEQQRISGIISGLDKKISKEKDSREQLQRLKKGLMQDLLTGEVRTKNKDIEVVDEVMEVEG